MALALPTGVQRGIGSKRGGALLFDPADYFDLFFGRGANATTALIANESATGWPSLTGVNVQAADVEGGVIDLDGTNKYYEDQSVNTVSNFASVPVPDASGGDSGEGYTCTGLDLIPAGLLGASEPEEWFTGNDGRGASSDTSNEPSVVILSKDGLTKRREFIPSIGDVSIQGTAVNTVTGEGAYVTTESPRKVRIINLLTGVEQSNFDVDSDANGLAHNPTAREYYVLKNSGLIKRYNEAGVYQGDLTTLSGSAQDMLHFDDVNQILWASLGANGNNGTMRGYSLARDTWGNDITLTGSTAIEGIYIQGTKLYALNDGYFHNDTPGGNVLVNYDFDPTQQIAKLKQAYTKLHILLPFKLNGAPDMADVIYTIGDPLSSQGAGLYAVSGGTNLLRVFVHNGTAYEFIAFTLDNNMTTESILSVLIDFDNNEVTVRQNGVLQDGGAKSFALAMDSLVYVKPYLGVENGDSRYINGVYRDFGLNGDALSAAEENAVCNYWATIAGITYTEIAAPAVPDAITDFATTSIGDTTTDLAFTAPASNGAAITDYEYRYRVGSSGGYTDFDDGTNTSLTVQLTGLTQETGYESQVRAVNSVGAGAWSNTASFTTDETPASFDIANLPNLIAYHRDDFNGEGGRPDTVTQSGGFVSQQDNIAQDDYHKVQATASSQVETGARALNSRNCFDYLSSSVNQHFDSNLNPTNPAQFTFANGISFAMVLMCDTVSTGSLQEYLFDNSENATGIMLRQNNAELDLYAYTTNDGLRGAGGAYTIAINTPTIVIGKITPSGVYFYQDGVAGTHDVGAITAITQSAFGLRFGAEYNGTDSFNGLLPVDVFCNDDWDDATINNIFAQLAAEFDITLAGAL